MLLLILSKKLSNCCEAVKRCSDGVWGRRHGEGGRENKIQLVEGYFSHSKGVRLKGGKLVWWETGKGGWWWDQDFILVRLMVRGYVLQDKFRSKYNIIHP